MKRNLIFSLLLLSTYVFSCEKIENLQKKEFHGFEFSPINHAKLKVEEGKLVVSKRLSDEEYGASFPVDAPEFLHFAFEGIPLGYGESFDVKVLGLVNGAEGVVHHYAYLGSGNDTSSSFRIFIPVKIVDSLTFSGTFQNIDVFEHTLAISSLPGDENWRDILVPVENSTSSKRCIKLSFNIFTGEIGIEFNWDKAAKIAVPSPQGWDSSLIADIDHLNISPKNHPSVGSTPLTEVQTRAVGGDAYKVSHVEAY